jgi:hypothetical protein
VLRYGPGGLRLWAWVRVWAPPYELADLGGDRLHQGVLALGCFCGLGVCCEIVSGCCDAGLGFVTGPLPMGLWTWSGTVFVKVGLLGVLWWSAGVLRCGLGGLRLWAWVLSWTSPHELAGLGGDRMCHWALTLGCFGGRWVCCDVVSGVWGFGLGFVSGAIPMALRTWSGSVVDNVGILRVLFIVFGWSASCAARPHPIPPPTVLTKPCGVIVLTGVLCAAMACALWCVLCWAICGA